MVEPWTPELRLEAAPSGCRLVLVGLACGEGPSLQAAARDLLVEVSDLVGCLRSTWFRLPTEIGPLDGRMLAFLWDVGELVDRGEDIRARVLGFSTEPDPAA